MVNRLALPAPNRGHANAMSEVPHERWETAPRGERAPFPLIRHLSAWTTPLLVPLPLTPNHLTSLSLLLGLAGAWMVYLGGFERSLIAGGLMILCYVFDNCDGEIARIKQQGSRFGERYDTFVDWVVHAVFFAALGAGVERETGHAIWWWLGAVAAAGGSINYLISLLRDYRSSRRDSRPATDAETQEHPRYDHPHGLKQWALFVFRELFRADFCFIVLLLALFDAMWLLLPAGAVGAQVYWLVSFSKSTGNFHV